MFAKLDAVSALAFGAIQRFVRVLFQAIDRSIPAGLACDADTASIGRQRGIFVERDSGSIRPDCALKGMITACVKKSSKK